MVEPAILGDVVELPGSAPPSGPPPVHDAIEAGQHRGSGAHGAGLESYHEGVPGQAVVDLPGSSRDHQDLGVRRDRTVSSRRL